MAGLLKNVRVVETGILIGVDLTGRLLGDEGADVVKVERPHVGDYLRDIGAKFSDHHSVFHLILNRNKRSVACDAKTAEGREIIYELVRNAGIFITGNIAETNQALGLDYETLRKVNPAIVYCQITGYGAKGPYARIPTHGWMMDALGGGAPPMALNDDGFVVPTGRAIPSTGGWILGPMFAAMACVSGLVRALQTGEGCYIDVSGADANVAAAYGPVARALNDDRLETKAPDMEATWAKYTYYQTKDGKFVMLGAIEEKFWKKWCEAVGRPDMVSQHNNDLVVDFAVEDNALRLEIQSVFSTKTQAEWMELAVIHDLPIGPALTPSEVTDDRHLASRGIVMEEHHPAVGPLLTVGNPILVDGEDFVLRSAPEHGQHTDEVLEELGYGSDACAELRKAGIIA